jgi:hypothetical protein
MEFVPFVLHLLSLIAETPTEKATLAVGGITIKWIKWGITYFGTTEGKSDIAALVALATDLGASVAASRDVSLPATASHPATTYTSTRDGVGGHLMPAGM